METAEQMYKIYARCNGKGEVIRFMTTFHHLNELSDTDVFVEQGYGDDYGNPQARNKNRLDVMDSRGVYLWVNDGGAIRKKTEEEIQADIAALPAPEPPPIEKLKEENILLKAQIQAVTERNDFIEDCMAEMAIRVYQ